MAAACSICFAASEVAPFAKTGGLADVAAALPRELRRQGHDVRVFMPCYAGMNTGGQALGAVEGVRDVPVELGWRRLAFTLRAGRLPGSEVPVYFVDCPELYHRGSVYTSDDDEHRRFALFAHAVLISCQRLGFRPDVIHSNDWHTGLIPLLARSAYEWDRLFEGTRHLLTIHNIGYQGTFPADVVDDLGLGPWRYLFDQEDLLAGRMSFLRTGLIYAHAISTVSPTYAREICTPAYGEGLDPLLRARRDRLVGILNGVDYGEWSPAQDRYIAHRYGPKRLAAKEENKRDVLERLGLPHDDGLPLFGVVSRLTAQKGFELCMPVLPELLGGGNARLVALGSGESRYEEFFTYLQERFPDRCVFYRGYHEDLAHRIEAGADFFLMPSLYEPCGLNQMFSLKYGTIPIVRRTGGLADSVEPLFADRGTGIVFDHFTVRGLAWALQAALRLWADPERLEAARRRGMAVDHSWRRRGREYTRLYRQLMRERPEGAGARS